MKHKTLFMETTAIDSQKTVSEIMGLLASAGATQTSNEYSGGRVVGLRWTMNIMGREVVFDMPARTEPIFKVLNSRRARGRSKTESSDKAQAERVAWRQLLRWTESQVAMIETGMVQAHEVFMPYIVVDGRTGQTLFQRMESQQFKMLEAPKGGSGLL